MCIGETIEQRKNDETLSVLENQLKIGLQGVHGGDINRMIFAYEPVWAIGTGERAEPDQIAQAHRTVVNGYLIGGASLDADEFVSIIKQTENFLKE